MKQTILIVDDSAFVREALSGALGIEEDVEIVAAKNGREALQVLERLDEISAIVIDVSMPILGGKEMLQQLGQVPNPGPFIVAIGTLAEQSVLEECLHLGADRILTKPLDVGVLRAILRNGLQIKSRECSS